MEVLYELIAYFLQVVKGLVHMMDMQKLLSGKETMMTLKLQGMIKNSVVIN